MQETLNSKKKGDAAFRHKDYRSAVEFYSQVKWSQSSSVEFISPASEKKEFIFPALSIWCRPLATYSLSSGNASRSSYSPFLG